MFIDGAVSVAGKKNRIRGLKKTMTMFFDVINERIGLSVFLDTPNSPSLCIFELFML